MNASESATLARLRVSVVATTLVVAAIAAVALLPALPYAALAVGVGAACGVANMLAIMRGSERLLNTRNAAFFGLSSLLRLAAFSIVAAALAVRGPWWALGPFLAAFFLPLATYAFRAWRLFRSKT
ncbi:MAG: hypothetical protein JO190_09395 [Candidatus Eremiobacteraeota bacterium]|nr:hypothetical protein [Candidatus Eremiobacteraeota bacterium]MBV8497915.1 hypothetical protein [Candidatus Eremiobacteraeota bacterium]